MVNQDHQGISLLPIKPQQQNLVHFVDEISANQIDYMLKRNEVDLAFLGIIQLVKEESEGMDAPEESTTT